MPETKSSIGGLILLMIVIVVGALLVSELGNQVSPLTNERGYTIVNETGYLTNNTYTLSASTIGNLYNFPVILTIQNTTFGATGQYLDAANWTQTGYTIRNTTTNTQGFARVNITYYYYPTEYVGDSGSRSALSLILIFFALGIFGYAVWYVWENWIKEIIE